MTVILRRIGLPLIVVVGLLCPMTYADDAPPASIKVANGLLNRKLYDLAEAEYRRVLTTDPKDERRQQAQYGLAVALMRQEKLAPATELLAELIDADEFEFTADVAIMFAQCKLAAAEYTAAAQIIADHREAFADHPLADDAAALGIEALYRAGHLEACAENADAFMARYVQSPSAGLVCAFAGMAKANLGKDRAAIKWLNNALRFDVPASHVAHVRLTLAEALARQGQTDEARAAFGELVDAAPPLAARAQQGLALLAWQTEDLASALHAINLALKHPDAIDRDFALQLRGRINFQRNAFADALSDFETLYDDEVSRSASDAYWLAKTLVRLDRNDRAVDVLNDAVEQYSDSDLIGDLRFERAVALVRLDRFDEALPSLKVVLAKHEEAKFIPEALRLCAIVTHRLSQFQTSSDYIAQWQARTKTDSDAFPADLIFIQAENAFLTDEFTDAITGYHNFLSTHETDDRATAARRRLGLAHYRMQQYEPALGALTKLANADHTPASIYAVGDIHFAQRDWQNAQTWLARFVAGKPKTGIDDGLIKLGLAQMRLSEFDSAIERFNALLERDADSPHAPQAMFERGQCLLALERFEDAARSFESVLKNRNAKRLHDPARDHLAALGLKLGKPELAARYYAEAAESSDDLNQRAAAVCRQSDSLLQAQQYADAAKAIRTFLKAIDDDTHKLPAATLGHLYANRVIALARAERYQQAADAFVKLNIESIDGDLRTTALFDFAYCLRKLEDNERATRVFQQIVETAAANPLKYHALMALAELAAQNKDNKRSLSYLDQLVAANESKKLSPDLAFDRALYQKSRAHFELQQFAPASRTLQTLLQQFPNSSYASAAQYLAGESAYAMQQWEAAAAHFDVALTAKPNGEYASTARLRLADCHLNLQRWPDAAQHFTAFLSDHSEHPLTYQARFGLAWSLENQGRTDDALKHYREVTKAHQGPTAARAQFQIGQCLFAQQQYEAAVGELLKTDILYAYPEWSAAALFEAGRCLERLQRVGAAREQFAAVTQRFAESKWAAPAQERLTALAQRRIPGG